MSLIHYQIYQSLFFAVNSIKTLFKVVVPRHAGAVLSLRSYICGA